MKIEGAIFDLDGTLLDSMGIWDRAGEDFLLSLGITPRENLAETLKEMSLAQAAEYLQDTYGVSKSVDEIIRDVCHLVEDFYIEKVPLKKGVKEVLEKLSKNHVKMCVATASERRLVDLALTRCGVRQHFTEIFTCNELGLGKDSPDIYEMARAHLGTPKENTFVFEDAIHAIRTAKAAGFPVVGIFDASEKDQETVRSLSDYYLESFMKFL